MTQLQQWAARAKQNDPVAWVNLWEELRTQMVPVVRRALRRGVGDSRLSQRILAEARACPRDRSDQHVQQVTRRLCESIVRDLKPQPAGGIMETVRG
jgi:hypothetical protein